jgi:Ca2+-binding RTX toxin-like protein
MEDLTSVIVDDSLISTTSVDEEILDPSTSTDVDPAVTTGVVDTGLEFTLSDGKNSATISLSEGEGGVLVSVSATDDILGVFFNLANDEAAILESLEITGDDVIATSFVADSVSKPGGNPGINPSAFDAGVETGNPGAGQDVLTETSFVISGVTLADITGEEFGVRTQSSKLTGDAIAIVETPEDDTSDSVDEVVDDVAEVASITGKSFALFGEPLEPGAAVFEILDADGGDDNRFEWGVPVGDSFVNVLQFDGLEFDVQADEIFSLGDLLYTNGTVNEAFNGEFPFTLKLAFDELTENDDDSDDDETSDSVDEVTDDVSDDLNDDDSDDDDSDDDASEDDDSDDDASEDDDSDDDASEDDDTSSGGEGDDDLDDADGVVNEVTDDDSSIDEVSDVASDALSFEFLFDIFNSPNSTGDAVLDGDRLRLNSGGVAPVSFELGGQEYTIQLIGFSSDGGESIRTGFNSPEESTANAELFAKVITLSDELSEFYDPLPQDVVDEVLDAGGVSIGGDADGTGAVAVSLLIESKITLQIHWGNTISALTADYETVADEDGDSDGDGLEEISLNTEDSNTVITSDDSEEISGTIDSDVVASGGGDDEIDCAEGNDIAAALEGDDMVEGGDGLDIINGNEGTDEVIGGEGDDLAFGGNGDDVVDGGGGDDVLTGDRGVDEVTGGDGADTFALMSKIDIETQQSLSIDIITDYEAGVDRLAISAEVISEVSFSIEDYNTDGTSDFVARLSGGQIFGVVLNISDSSLIESDILAGSMNDFVTVNEPALV